MHDNIQIIENFNNSTWDNLLKDNDNASVFYTSNWINVLAKTYGYKPVFFILYKKNVASAYIPFLEVNSILTGNRAISLPFSDNCEPFAESNEDFNKLFDYIKNYGKKKGWSTVELRGGYNFLKIFKAFSKYYEHLLNLNKPLKKIFFDLKDTVKRNIKKSLNYGVKIEISQSYGALKIFIYLNSLTRKRHGLPPQPDKFFKNLYDYIISKKRGYIIYAKYNNKTIASMIFIISGKNVAYKYGASDLKHQKLRANNLLMWEAIKFFVENKYECLSLGRTHPDNKGLLQFKKGFCRDIQTICYYKYDLIKDEFITSNAPQTNFVNTVFRFMPVFLLKAIGSLIYKHFA